MGGVYLTGRKYQYIIVNPDIVEDIEEDIKNRYTKEKLEELIKISRDFADFVEKKQKRIHFLVKEVVSFPEQLFLKLY